MTSKNDKPRDFALILFWWIIQSIGKFQSGKRVAKGGKQFNKKKFFQRETPLFHVNKINVYLGKSVFFEVLEWSLLVVFSWFINSLQNFFFVKKKKSFPDLNKWKHFLFLPFWLHQTFGNGRFSWLLLLVGEWNAQWWLDGKTDIGQRIGPCVVCIFWNTTMCSSCWLCLDWTIWSWQVSSEQCRRYQYVPHQQSSEQQLDYTNTFKEKIKISISSPNRYKWKQQSDAPNGFQTFAESQKTKTNWKGTLWILPFGVIHIVRHFDELQEGLCVTWNSMIWPICVLNVVDDTNLVILEGKKKKFTFFSCFFFFVAITPLVRFNSILRVVFSLRTSTSLNVTVLLPNTSGRSFSSGQYCATFSC